MHYELVLFLCLAVSLHELGHAFAMRKYGIQMNEICLLGLGGPKLLSFRMKNIFGETPITVRAFIFGGFVAPTYFGRLRIYCIGYDKAGHIYGGGIAVNFLLAALLFFIHSLVEGHFETRMVWSIGVLLVLGLAPQFTFRLFPLLGLMLAVMFVKHFMYNTANTSGLQSAMNNMMNYLATDNSSVSDKLYFGGLVSVSLGLINCIPVLPSDGGKIIERMLCGISYQYRNVIVGVYKLAIIPLIVFLLFAFLRH